MAEQAAPKRPQTAYFLWSGENRAAVVEALGGVQKGSEVSKKAGEMWKALSAEQRAPYEQRFKEAKAAFDAEKPAKQEKEKPQEGEEVRKKPMTPVFAFIQAKRAEINAMGITALGPVSKKATEMFKALPAEEQAKWQQRYEEQMKEYKEWAGGEGQAAVAAKKGAKAAKKGAKVAKKAAKAAKVARKEARAAGAGAEAKAGAEDGEAKPSVAKKGTAKEKKAARAAVAAKKGTAKEKKAAKAAPKAAGKRKAEAEGEPEPKAAKVANAKAKAKAEDAAPPVAAAVLKQAAALGKAASGVSYTSLLEKLVGTAGVQGKVSDTDALAALKKHGGLLNKARAELCGMAGA